MEFIEKYCNTKDKDKLKNKEKIVLSNEIYALREVLLELNNTIEHTRTSLL